MIQCPGLVFGGFGLSPSCPNLGNVAKLVAAVRGRRWGRKEVGRGREEEGDCERNEIRRAVKARKNSDTLYLIILGNFSQV